MGPIGLVLFVLVPAVQTASAQGITTTVSIEAGAIRIKQRNRGALVSPTVTLTTRVASTRGAISGSALLVQSRDNAGASQVALGGEFLLPRSQSLRLEATGSATFFDAPEGKRETSTSGMVRAHFARDRFGAFGTAGTGVIGRSIAKFRAVQWDAGAWARRGALNGVLTMRNSYSRDYPLVETSEFVLTNRVMYSVRDFAGTLSAQFGRVEWQATGAWRNGVGATVGHTNAFSMAATARVTSRLALTVNAGKQLAEWLTGVPSAHVLGVSGRVTLRGASPRRVAPSRSAAVSPFATDIQRPATGGATVRIRVDAPANALVELSGTFNEWAVVTVSRVGTLFEQVLQLPPGTHRIAVRINGGEWKSPAGLARVKDDLGGEAGLVVVP